ncbi:prenyltransferase [Kitasatospora viridis]|uniref:1,4-dihydroxy-2-naphthoate octaprenyltransferase n=1 Tax=Kitasatospora viridis TaxID=281105 RepID=A0A561T6R3_9ACTN|nr:prenyltransferase [Kitasatospora viridis]TWF82815.1 1,4-dihydroxy-2-naphthoate octaprenyltransferase [Kitasatospora viridis]
MEPVESSAGRVRAFIRLGRPKFLVQSMMVVGLGVTLAVHDGHAFRPARFVLTLLFAWCTHLMTHYCNEYFDLEADRANAAPTGWTGGSRVLVSGLLRPQVSLGAAFVLLFAAVGLIAAMPTAGARAVAAVITALSWFYTAPPLRLNYRALGEAACAVVLYGLGPVLARTLQAGAPTGADLVWVGAVCALQFLRMSVMNLADIEGDRRTGKRTLAVLLRPPGLTRLYLVGQLVVAGTAFALAVTGAVPWSGALAVAATGPIAAWVARRLLAGALERSETANAVTFWASVHLPLTTCAITLSLFAGQPVRGAWPAVYGVALAAFLVWLAGAVRGNLPRRTS